MRALPEVNPVAWAALQELAAMWPSQAHEILDAGTFLADLLGLGEPGAPRIALGTASRVLAETEANGDRDVHRSLASMLGDDVLLRLSVDAILASCDRSRRPRIGREREGVAVTLYALLRMAREQAEADALEEALAS
jgi:hypothetical protein